MAKTGALGLQAHMEAFALRGSLSRDQWRQLIDAVVTTIRMTPVGHMALWEYPGVCPGGKGPNGDIFVQPISESFIALDTWPDHDGAYLFICSCRPFDPSKLYPLFADMKLNAVDSAGHLLELK